MSTLAIGFVPFAEDFRAFVQSLRYEAEGFWAEYKEKRPLHKRETAFSCSYYLSNSASAEGNTARLRRRMPCICAIATP